MAYVAKSNDFVLNNNGILITVSLNTDGLAIHHPLAHKCQFLSYFSDTVQWACSLRLIRKKYWIHWCSTEWSWGIRSTIHATAYMQSALYAIAIPSVCPSVTRVDQSKTVEVRITQLSPHPSSFCRVRFIQKFWRVPPERGRQTGGVWKKRQCVNMSKTVRDMSKVTTNN